MNIYEIVVKTCYVAGIESAIKADAESIVNQQQQIESGCTYPFYYFLTPTTMTLQNSNDILS